MQFTSYFMQFYFYICTVVSGLNISTSMQVIVDRFTLSLVQSCNNISYGFVEQLLPTVCSDMCYAMGHAAWNKSYDMMMMIRPHNDRREVLYFNHVLFLTLRLLVSKTTENHSSKWYHMFHSDAELVKSLRHFVHSSLKFYWGQKLRHLASISAQVTFLTLISKRSNISEL